MIYLRNIPRNKEEEARLRNVELEAHSGSPEGKRGRKLSSDSGGKKHRNSSTNINFNLAESLAESELEKEFFRLTDLNETDKNYFDSAIEKFEELNFES